MAERRASYAAAKSEDCSPGATEIFKVAESLIGAESTPAQQLQAMALAGVAFMMVPCGGHDGLARRLLALPLPVSDKLRLLTVLAAAGYVVPADLVLDGVRDWLERAKRDWHLANQHRFGLQEWLRLLPMSDRVGTVLEAHDLLPPDYRPNDMDQLLIALGHSPAPGALEVMLELARRDPILLDRHDWLRALLRQRTPAMVLALVDFGIANGSSIKGTDLWYASKELAPLIAGDAALRAELLRRYESVASGPAPALMEQIFSDAADAEIVLAMVRRRTEPGVDGALRHAIECAVTERRHNDERGMSYEVQPISAHGLRQALFSEVREGGANGALAASVLTVIDKLRDDYGAPEGEPRHPDISSGVPWPTEAGVPRGTI